MLKPSRTLLVCTLAESLVGLRREELIKLSRVGQLDLGEPSYQPVQTSTCRTTEKEDRENCTLVLGILVERLGARLELTVDLLHLARNGGVNLGNSLDGFDRSNGICWSPRSATSLHPTRRRAAHHRLSRRERED